MKEYCREARTMIDSKLSWQRRLSVPSVNLIVTRLLLDDEHRVIQA